MAWLLAGTAVMALGLAAWQDLATRLIPNALCGLILACGLGQRLLLGELLPGLLAGLLVFAGALGLWWPGWLGGGDVKLLAAVATLPAPAAVPSLLLAIALAGGPLAALYLLLQRRPAAATPRPARLLPRVLRAEARRIRRGSPLPYGLAIGAGTLATTLTTTLATWGGG